MKAKVIKTIRYNIYNDAHGFERTFIPVGTIIHNIDLSLTGGRNLISIVHKSRDIITSLNNLKILNDTVEMESIYEEEIK